MYGVVRFGITYVNRPISSESQGKYRRFIVSNMSSSIFAQVAISELEKEIQAKTSLPYVYYNKEIGRAHV